MFPKRGEIYLTDLEPVKGSEQGKTRPVIIVQNNIGNEFSPTTVIIPITSKFFSKKYPHIVEVKSNKTNGLDRSGSILCGQIRCIDKSRLIKKIGSLSEDRLNDMNKALKINLDLL